MRTGEGNHRRAVVEIGAAVREQVVADPHKTAFDVPAELVHVADEAIRERRRRIVVDLLRRADLLDLALVHQHDAIGDFERLLLVVRHENGRDVQLVVETAEPPAQFLAHLRVERAERLVEQEHLRFHRESAGQRDALTLSAGELRRETVGQPSELHEIEQTLDTLLDLRARRALATRLNAQAERDVLEHGQMPEQRVVLEHEADAAFADVLRGSVLAGKDDRALIRLLKAGNDAKQRGLAAARRAKQRHQLARRKGQVDVVERFKGAKRLRDILNLDAHPNFSSA